MILFIPMLLTGLTAKQLSWGDVRLTYRDFLDKIDSVASVLLSKGMKRGNKVALWSVASPAWLYNYIGIIRAGGIAVLLNTNLSIKDAKPLVEFADTKYILFGKTHDFEGRAQDIDIISEVFGDNAENGG